MNEKKLKDNLNSAKLIIGDIKHTVNPFKKKQLTHPIGFVAFDLDYYSSKIASFEIFKINDDLLLPRIECYMDDVSSTELLVASKGTGVLKAISDFNNKEKKIFRKTNVSHSRRIPSSWNKKVYVFHSFDHSKYNDTVSSI